MSHSDYGLPEADDRQQADTSYEEWLSDPVAQQEFREWCESQ